MFNEKTGNPGHDNEARRINKSIRRAARTSLKVHARGWKRRHYIARIERRTYAELIVTIMTHKIQNQQKDQP